MSTPGPAAQHILDQVSSRTGHAPRRSGIGYSARCPAHEDRGPSLSITPIEGSVLLHCHAGCTVDAILRALDLQPRHLYDDPKGATYRYEAGRIVHRTPGKRFHQSGDLSRTELYHLTQLTAATEGAIFLVEGEKDVHAIEAAGGVATTAPMGAANFDKVDITPLRGRWVTAIVDKDRSGHAWAALVSTTLSGHVRGLRFVVAATGKDAADHIAAGHPLDQFVAYEPPHPLPAPPELGQEPHRRLSATPASTITMRAARWLYDRRIPTGAITLLGGREGIGKSSISYDLAAKITRGELVGEHFGTPRSVGVVATEDAWHEVVVPRLHAAGADLDRVYQIQAHTEEGALDAVSVPADLDRLATLTRELEIALILLDPLMSVIHSSIDTHKDREVRIALDPLARFAAATRIAVLGLLHANKSATTDPLNSLMASRAFSAVARSVLYCIVDPEAEREDRYLFGHVKSNLGPRQPTLGYHLIEVHFELNGGGPNDQITTSRAIWDGDDGRSIRDIMETPRVERAESELARRILTWLSEQGPRTVPVAEIIREFRDTDRRTVDTLLSRLVKRGKLTRPLHGHYALP